MAAHMAANAIPARIRRLGSGATAAAAAAMRGPASHFSRRQTALMRAGLDHRVALWRLARGAIKRCGQHGVLAVGMGCAARLARHISFSVCAACTPASLRACAPLSGRSRRSAARRSVQAHHEGMHPARPARRLQPQTACGRIRQPRCAVAADASAGGRLHACELDIVREQRLRKRAMLGMCRGAGTQAEAAYNKLLRIKNGTSKTVRALQGADARLPSGPLDRRSE